ncbi:MAG TPA: hypothetical protein VGQ46_20100 [Thermoanaerobaculia bacterium]|jgi:hypothetical protein|nr:hypothetical protein [Thermoanaerobaculia bacterium]
MPGPFLALSFLFVSVALHGEFLSERPVSSVVYGPAPGRRAALAAASDRHDFLVAWTDLRNRSNVITIYAARMKAATEVLDPIGIPISSTANNPRHLSVIFLGNVYLIYWNETSADVGNVQKVLCARVSREGVLLDPVPRLLAENGQLSYGAAATNGNRTVILFHVAGNERIIVMDRDGNIAAGPKTFTNFGVSAAMVASDGRGFLIVWSLAIVNGETLFETLLDGDGGVIAPEKKTLSNDRFLYALAFGGDGYLLIAGNGLVTAALHLSGEGGLLERSPIQQQPPPALLFADGSFEFMEFDIAAHTIGVRRLDRSGKPAGAYMPIASAGFGSRTLAFNGSETAVFWTDDTGSIEPISGGVFRNPFELTKATSFPQSANAQTAPRAATNGRNIAVVWNESSGTYAGRVTLDGQQLDGRGIRIGDHSVTRPDIVFDGTNYLIGWSKSHAPKSVTVNVARLFPGLGAVLDPDGIAIASATCVAGLALSAGPAATLVTWSDCNHVLANSIDRNGSLGTATTVTPPETTQAGMVSAAWNGREWLVAWEDLLSPNFPIFVGPILPEFSIKAARLSSSLALLDPRPITLANTGIDYRPVAASDGNDFLVAWTFSPDYRGKVMAQRISSNGSLLSNAKGTGIANGRVTSVVWDGTQYDVAFSTLNGVPSTLYVTHVAASGPIEASATQSVISNIVDPDAAVIVTQAGHVKAAYSDVATDASYGGVERVFLGEPHAIRKHAARNE